MIRVRAVVALAVFTATALTGCSAAQDTGRTLAPAPSSTAAAPTALALGQSRVFTRIDTGARIGEIRFAAIKALPTECIAGRRDGLTLAIQVEIINGPGEQLPIPDTYSLKYVDAIGATRAVETASIYGCEADYPLAVTASPGGNAQGWFTVRVEGEPAELIYTPVVGDQTSTAGNIKLLTVAPATINVDVPDHLAGRPIDTTTVPAPAPETTSPPTVPVTTTVRASTPVAPLTGLDSQGRPNGSGGALVECADENYEPGTGVFADGSKGFAAECLPGGSMR